MKCDVINDVKLNKTVYCHTLLKLSNEMSGYKFKCIRICYTISAKNSSGSLLFCQNTCLVISRIKRINFNYCCLMKRWVVVIGTNSFIVFLVLYFQSSIEFMPEF